MASAAKIRIGAVSYLNTKPLVYGLAERLPDCDLAYDLPSRLALKLARGELDIALIPSIEFFQDPSYSMISDACIGCRGPVLSVKLFSHVPVNRIRTLALDEGSRTSRALLQILLRERFDISPELTSLPIDADPTAIKTDAMLLIGDRAIHAPEGDWAAVWDLGHEWNRWSGLPFVFAMWVARSGIDEAKLAEIDRALRESRDDGVAHLETIAAREAAHVKLGAAECLSYLRDNLYFYLGTREERGLELFYRHALALGFAPAGRTWEVSERPVVNV